MNSRIDSPEGMVCISRPRRFGKSYAVPDAIQKDLVALYPYLASEPTLTDCLLRCVEKEEKKFVFIIDEWDAVIREAKEEAGIQKAYLNLLRGWLKNISFTPKAVAAAYLTGILPIKKDGSQSAICGKVAEAISVARDTHERVMFIEGRRMDGERQNDKGEAGGQGAEDILQCLRAALVRGRNHRHADGGAGGGVRRPGPVDHRDLKGCADH